MRVPTLLRAAAAVAALALPPTVAAQSFATMKLTTQSPEAAAAFREGTTNVVMLYPSGAVRQFRVAVEKDPGFAVARAFLASNNATLTRAQRIAEIDRAVADAARASTTELLIVLQAREEANGRDAAAQAILRSIKALLPEEAAYYGVGLAPTTTPKEAAARWRDAMTKFPQAAAPLNAYAYSLWNSGDRKGALDAARQQVERFGKSPNPHDSYAELLAWNGDLAGAATHYQHAIDMAPDFSEAYVGLAELAILRGDMAKARSEIERAIQHTDDPDLRIGYTRQIAATYALEANREATAEHLRKAADAVAVRDDTVGMGLLAAQLATLDAIANRADAAHALIARASALRPHAPQVYYFNAMSHAVMGHEAQAKATLAAARAEPNLAAGAKTRLTAVEGYIHIKAERPKDALAVLMKADTTDLVVLSWIAQANRMAGSTTRADAQFTRIRDDRGLNLLDYAEVNARARARTALAPRAAVRE